MGSGNFVLGELMGIVTQKYVDMWEGMRMGRDRMGWQSTLEKHEF